MGKKISHICQNAWRDTQTANILAADTDWDSEAHVTYIHVSYTCVSLYYCNTATKTWDMHSTTIKPPYILTYNIFFF